MTHFTAQLKVAVAQLKATLAPVSVTAVKYRVSWRPDIAFSLIPILMTANQNQEVSQKKLI